MYTYPKMFGHWTWEIWAHWRPKPQLSSAEGYCTRCTPTVSYVTTQKTNPFVSYRKEKSVLKKPLAALACFYNFQLKQPFTQQTENMDGQTDWENFTQAYQAWYVLEYFQPKQYLPLLSFLGPTPCASLQLSFFFFPFLDFASFPQAVYSFPNYKKSIHFKSVVTIYSNTSSSAAGKQCKH